MIHTAIHDMRRSEVRFLPPFGQRRPQEIVKVKDPEDARALLAKRGYTFNGGDLIECNKVYTKRVDI